MLTSQNCYLYKLFCSQFNHILGGNDGVLEGERPFAAAQGDMGLRAAKYLEGQTLRYRSG